MDYELKTETKINVYRKIYNEVKNDPDVLDVGYPKEKEDLDFYGKIGDFLFDFSIKTKVDMLKVKASGDFNLSEDQLLDYGNSIAENETGIMFTTYDQKVIFQLSLPLTGMEDTAAESMMVESTRRFIAFMKIASDKMNELKKENPVLKNKNESKTELPVEQLTETTKENEAVAQNTDQSPEQELNVSGDENVEPEKKAELSDDTAERANATDPDTEPVGINLDAEDESVENLPSTNLSSDTQASEKDMELESISSDFSYEQAPEVKQQMADMYDALERSFDKKKEQILFREKLLKKQKAILEDEKVQLQEKKNEFAKDLERLTAEKEKLENEWVTYNNADTELRNKQQAMKTQEKQYRESEKFFKQKEQSFKDKNDNLEKRIASVNARTNAMKDKEKKLDSFEQSLKRQQQDIQRKLSDISDKETILQIREKDLRLKEEQINLEKDAITEKMADLKELEEYVSGLSSTFEDDKALTHVSDLSACTNLRNMTRTYAGCVALTKIPELPASVVNAQEMCQGCTELQNTPDATHAENLTNASGMYQDCKKLTNVSMPPNVQNMDKMLSSCINLKAMPEIPETAKSMSASFEGDSALKTLTIIPKNVEDVTGCLRGCSKIEGMLWIDANPKNYSAFLGDAAVATKVDLQGNSKMLNVLANTSDENDNITVDGKIPDRDANYSSIEIEENED